MTNPWNLTAAEILALEAVIQAGTEKGAAMALGKAKQTIAAQLLSARHRMRAPSRLHAVLVWDRWRIANRRAA